MGYERSKFGDGSSAGSGNVVQEVSNHYGPRDVGGTTGISNSDGWMRELTIDLDPESVSEGDFVLTVAPVLKAGTLVKEVFLEVEEAFVLGGTTPAVEVGTEGSEATNGVTLDEADLEAVGTYDVTANLSGTWTAGFTADTTVGLAFSGTSPTVTDVGKARVVVRYFHA